MNIKQLYMFHVFMKHITSILTSVLVDSELDSIVNV